MKTTTILSFIGTLTNVVKANLENGESSAVVKIESFGDSEVKASSTNTLDAPLRILRTGSLLDPSPVEKVKILKGCTYTPD